MALVGHHGILALAAIAIEVGNGGQAMLLAPIGNDIGRVVDVGAVEVSLVGEFLKGFEVVVLVGEPIGIDKPEHPLRRHLEEAAASPTGRKAIGLDLQLERMAKLMGQAVELAVLYAVGGYPKGANEIVVGATVGRALKRVVDHDHHLVTVGLTTGQAEAERVAEEMIEILHTVLEALKVEAHGMAFELWRVGGIVAKAFLPEEHEVACLRRVHPRITAAIAGKINGAQFLRNENALLR